MGPWPPRKLGSAVTTLPNSNNLKQTGATSDSSGTFFCPKKQEVGSVPLLGPQIAGPFPPTRSPVNFGPQIAGTFLPPPQPARGQLHNAQFTSASPFSYGLQYPPAPVMPSSYPIHFPGGPDSAYSSPCEPTYSHESYGSRHRETNFPPLGSMQHNHSFYPHQSYPYGSKQPTSEGHFPKYPDRMEVFSGGWPDTYSDHSLPESDSHFMGSCWPDPIGSEVKCKQKPILPNPPLNHSREQHSWFCSDEQSQSSFEVGLQGLQLSVASLSLIGDPTKPSEPHHDRVIANTSRLSKLLSSRQQHSHEANNVETSHLVPFHRDSGSYPGEPFLNQTSENGSEHIDGQNISAICNGDDAWHSCSDGSIADSDQNISSDATAFCDTINYSNTSNEHMETVSSSSSTNRKELSVSVLLDCHKTHYPFVKAGFSLYLHTPVSDTINGKCISIKGSFGEGFDMPHGWKQVSAVYSTSTDLSVELTYDIEHCFRGDEAALAFAYCKRSHPPFHFRIASRRDYECAFSYTHATIRAKPFNYLAIVRRCKPPRFTGKIDLTSSLDSSVSASGDDHDEIQTPPEKRGGSCNGSLSRGDRKQQSHNRHYSHSRPPYRQPHKHRRRRKRDDDDSGGDGERDRGASGGSVPSTGDESEEEISVKPYYRIARSHIEVNLCVLQNLRLYHTLLQEDYKVWQSKQVTSGMTFLNDGVTVVHVKVGQEWSPVGNNWHWKYASPPVVRRKTIEKEYGAIKLLYRCSDDIGTNRTLDHGATLEGLVVVGYPAHVNYMIDWEGEDYNNVEPVFKRLEQKHLSELCEILTPCSPKWRKIGTHLGFTSSELDSIEAKPTLQHNAPASYMTTLLADLLKWAPKDARGSKNYASFQSLKAAVDKAGFGATAQKIY